MEQGFESLLGVGIYGVPEASRLTGVSPGRIRRWLGGYHFPAKSGRRHSPPVWKSLLPRVDEDLALSFLDLQEVRFIDAFRKLGVSWRNLRRVEELACSRYGLTHPFCTLRFKAGGRAIFRETEDRVYDFVTNQRYIARIIDPFLRDVDFQGQYPRCWWFLGHGREVVLDPARSFGKPIVHKGGYLTRIIAKTVRAEGSTERVASWYGIEKSAVQDALECEKRIRGRAA